LTTDRTRKRRLTKSAKIVLCDSGLASHLAGIEVKSSASRHTLRLESILTVQDRKRLPRCVALQRACPPEDVGGTGGYTEFLAALADPENPEHDHYLEWARRNIRPRPGICRFAGTCWPSSACCGTSR
jgi:hypothetical protein